jgi:pimeloyl-ACP methyl ester carboxylesterase
VPPGWNSECPRYQGSPRTGWVPEALNEDPSPIEAITVPAIIQHLEQVIGELDSPPILIGHSAGGAFVQILLDHGFGIAGVADQLRPHRGRARRSPVPDQGHAPGPEDPANRHRAVGFTHEQWQYAFTNTFSEDESRRLYERYHIPASGSIFWGSVLANLQPGHQDTWVDYHNDDRAPLLFISGSEDHLMPPKIQQSNAKHYKSNTVTEVKEYEGRAHLLPAQEGWEEVADYALDWAMSHAGAAAARA